MPEENENTYIAMPHDIRDKYFVEINDGYHNFNDLDNI